MFQLALSNICERPGAGVSATSEFVRLFSVILLLFYHHFFCKSLVLYALSH